VTAPAISHASPAASTGRTGTIVTGIGVAAPNGLTVDDYWSATLAGHSAIAELPGLASGRYSARLGGVVSAFDDKRHVPGRLLPQTDRVTRLAIYAAGMALRDADVAENAIADYDMGVMLSNSCGGFEFTHREFKKLWAQGPEYVSVYESFAWFYACNTGQISIRHGMRGPSAALVAEQAGGLDAVGFARRAIRGGTSLMLTGGFDSAFDPWGWVSHLSTAAVSRERVPDRAYLPFGRRPPGFVPGEGGAVLVMENEASAAVRGAPHRYGAVAGYAATFDPRPGSERPPGLGRAAAAALADAGLEPREIDVVFADGAGVGDLDAVEARAISGLFGPAAVPVSVPKAFTGRLGAGGAPLDVVAALLSIRDGVIPATASATEVPAEYEIDVVVGEPRRQEVRRALILARGRGGFNAALVVTA
jgi:act minimal PKS chain-length factor (CLF/KS beta)